LAINGCKKLNHKRQNIIEYLAFLSVKQNIYLAELFQAMVSARERGKASCQHVLIEYRGSVRDNAIFLITKDTSVIAQFRVTEQLLRTKDICFENWMDTDKIRKQLTKQNTDDNSILVHNLRHGMKKINIEAEVLETLKPQLVHTQYGNSAMVTNAWIADETGKVKLCLWNEQANSITTGDTIQIKGASVATYNGERQLRLGKTGVVTVIQSNNKPKKIPQALAEETIYAKTAD
jgi:replication factor A1